MGRKLRTRRLVVKPQQINYVHIGDKTPFAFWIYAGKIHVSLIDKEYEVNLIGVER